MNAPPSTRRPWQTSEHALVAKLWPAAPAAELLESLPGRSWSSIGHYAGRIGLQRTRIERHYTWSAADRALMRAHFATKGTAWLVAKLGRSEDAVRSCATRLGLNSHKRGRRRRANQRRHAQPECR